MPPGTTPTYSNCSESDIRRPWEFPRGRVMFNNKTENYLLLADACILGNKQMLNCILREMNLPKAKTVIDRDSHYRCFCCLGRT